MTDDAIPNLTPANKPKGRPPGSKNKVTIQKAVNTKSNTVPHIAVPEDNAAPERAPMRPPMRADDSRSAAAKRAAEIMGHIENVSMEGVDNFAAPKPPDGWTYEWKRHTIYNQEDPAYQVKLAQTGWEPVPLSRHPETMPSNAKSATIERDGQILMMRPKEVTEHFQKLDKQRARDLVRFKEQQLAGTPDGTLTRDDPRVKPKIKKGYSPLDIPTE